jgi:hypothetical protein
VEIKEHKVTEITEGEFRRVERCFLVEVVSREDRKTAKSGRIGALSAG